MEKVIMTVKEAAELLRVSKDSLYRDVRRGRIKHFKIGATILFRRDTLQAWIEQQEKESIKAAKYSGDGGEANAI
nr:helix-turn-helix domain-containing protein [Aneurinibacillus sp. XH2]